MNRILWNELFADRTRSMRSSAIRDLQEVIRQPGVISFAGGMPADDLFPIDELVRSCEQTLRTLGSQALQYGVTEGEVALRDAIARRVSRHGVHVSADNVLVTTGSQQALDLIGKVMIDPGDAVIVERPTYVGALQAWSVYGARYTPVGVDEHGARVDELETALEQRAKLVYSIPNFQNPTGALLPEDRRRALVQMAAQRGVPIVEDDPYGELRYEGVDLPPLLALDVQRLSDAPGEPLGNVLYLGTFSKTLSPGLRLGWVVGPAEVIARLSLAKQGADLHTSTFTQLVALEVLRSGFLDEHVRRLRPAYGERRDAMLAAMSASFPHGVTWTRPAGGLFVWVTLPPTLDATEVLRQALSDRVAFVPGASFFPDQGGTDTMRLNFTHASPERIRDGVLRLAKVLDRFVRNAGARSAACISAASGESQGRATSPMTGADAIAAGLSALNVRHVFGVGGANIEEMFLAVQRRRPQMMAILDKHEHSAGAAADAYARVSRSLGVVMTTSGGGAMNLVPALAESMASRVPVLAIVGEPPTGLQGRGAFQDTSGRGESVDVGPVFRGVSAWCERARAASDLPGLVHAAAAAAWEHRGPAVLLVAKDLQQASFETGPTAEPGLRRSPPPEPSVTAIRAASQLLRADRGVVIAGDEVSRTGAQRDLQRIADALDARVVVTPDGRGAFDNNSPRFSGVAGAMGHESAARAIADASVCLIVGTRLPLLARQGHEPSLETKTIVSIGRGAPYVGSRPAVHLGGDLPSTLRALASELEAAGQTRRGAAPVPLGHPSSSPSRPFGSEAILRAIERTIPDDGVVLVDAGNTGAHAVHYLGAPTHGHWLVAMGMAGMGYTFGAAVGAAFATGRRCLVLSGDGAFFMHGLEIHTAVQHQLPITYVIFNNRAHGMCLIRERLLLGEEAGYNVFTESEIGRGLGAMFPGLAASDCRTLEEVERALAGAATTIGPSVICAELADVEVPPFAAFLAAIAARTAAGGTARP